MALIIMKKIHAYQFLVRLSMQDDVESTRLDVPKSSISWYPGVQKLSKNLGTTSKS
jgi:hypothetical protein